MQKLAKTVTSIRVPLNMHLCRTNITFFGVSARRSFLLDFFLLKVVCGFSLSVIVLSVYFWLEWLSFLACEESTHIMQLEVPAGSLNGFVWWEIHWTHEKEDGMALRMKMNIPQRASERKRKRKKPSQVNSNSRVLVPPSPFFSTLRCSNSSSTFCSICRFSTYVCIHQRKMRVM